MGDMRAFECKTKTPESPPSGWLQDKTTCKEKRGIVIKIFVILCLEVHFIFPSFLHFVVVD